MHCNDHLKRYHRLFSFCHHVRDLSAAAAALHCVLPSILPANLSADYTERRCHRVRDFVPLVVAEIPHAVARPGSDGGETFL